MRVSVASVFALMICGLASAQDQPLKPVDVFRSARDLIASGKFDLAAERLKSFLDSEPLDKDFLDLEDRFGATVFQRLLRIERWSDNATADANAKKTVDAILAKSAAVHTKIGRDPKRIELFIGNLTASPAERDFAVDQLQFAGYASVPYFVSAFKKTRDAKARVGLLQAITKLPPQIVPGILTATEPASDLTDDVKAALLGAIAERKDIVQIVERAESNPLPILWNYAKGSNPILSETAGKLLNGFTGGASIKQQAEEQLHLLAEPFRNHKAKFASEDGMTKKVQLWVWDSEKALPKPVVLSRADAEEYLGLKYLRWASGRNPKSEAVQLAFLTLATERGIERAKFGDLSKTEPAVYELLASANGNILATLLETALAENNTGLAIGALQVLSDRGQRDASISGTGKLTPYMRALNYPDLRVQFAAAVATLRSPNASANESKSKVVEVLTRALSAAVEPSSDGKLGKVLIADPSITRGDRLASQFRDLGYSPEKFNHGRDLLRRIAKSADFDLIVLDRHCTDPQLADMLSHISSDPNAGRRPMLVVASNDKAQPIPVEVLLLRLAVLIAVTETEKISVPAPYAFNAKLPDLDREQARAANVGLRDAEIYKLATARLARLKRLTDAADLPTSETLTTRLEARLPQLTQAVVNTEFGATASTAPSAVRALAEATSTIKAQQRLNESIAKIKDTENLVRIVEQLEGALDSEQTKRFADFLPRVSPAPLYLSDGDSRDLELERKLGKQVAGFIGARVVPEPFGPNGLAEDLKLAFNDPTAMPRAPEEKLATAKRAAEWLRRIAIGEYPGYEAKPAEATLRTAIRSDDLAPDAIEALAKLGSGDSQISLVQTASNGSRPLAIRTNAADAAARHIQAFGKLAPAPLAEAVQQAFLAEKDLTLRGKLAVLAHAVAANRLDLPGTIRSFPNSPRVPVVEAPKEVKPAEEPKK